MGHIFLIIAAIILIGVTLYLTHEPILTAIGDFLVVQDDHLQPADMIHILGGSFDRGDYGVELYHQGHAPRLFVTGRACVAYKELAMAGGVRPDDLAPVFS